MFGSSSTSAATHVISVLFSEPKIPQFPRNRRRLPRARQGFSALQRAENSSILGLNRQPRCNWRFSALQRAENSSMASVPTDAGDEAEVSVLFSEPKIPQCLMHVRRVYAPKVSVLFSEPKIPQSNGSRST